LRIEDCDLLIGIFWKRFGTPVSDAESGTAHEFQKAYRAWRARGQPQIMVYFNQKAYKPKNREETAQQRKVLDFGKNFPKEGLWWTYTGKANFEALVRGHLTRYVARLAKDVVRRDDPDRAVDQELELLRTNPDRAATKYREAIQLNPESAEAHNGLGVALHFKRDLEGAAAELREAIRLNPEIAYQHNNLCAVLHDKGDLDGAIVEFREAFRLDPSHAKSHANLGEILSKKRDRKGALAQYSIASKLRPDNALYRSVYEGLKAEVESVNEEL